ncbi:hypothetical protein [Paeniglutamicibacter psychrophenolicus]|uniref:hypothetical protein n=1 Tax=Paeniglutamicibacter psychrophenolicus TaxID=257454 RepID=UPI002784C422|nr:hypothetical protein [Paeniglutamicibacter psychrophenolicus]MDQ0093062.1 hypothetical protein [Paeniglutamicibacter psychrophenolicus]
MSDLRNIALTIEADACVEDLKRVLALEDQMSLIRLGFAYAIEKGLSPERDISTGTPGGANYVSSNLDDEGLMAFIVQETHPVHASEPYRVVQILMSKGLRRLALDISQGHIGSVGDIFDQV